eukprot:TRINITY_DN27124_c0_g1_i1.p3 TRINITY_DN27124_c0_g1~~TRINITY_DN27124_c0_g1_i1.p3  ORF type:complete len:103 (+),score=3.81 TRINITY_DN27124_c0_g1_i1:268-576(+)
MVCDIEDEHPRFVHMLLASSSELVFPFLPPPVASWHLPGGIRLPTGISLSGTNKFAHVGKGYGRCPVKAGGPAVRRPGRFCGRLGPVSMSGFALHVLDYVEE